MEDITLSIVTPAYNAQEVMERGIKSILPQLTQEVEWIIIDDGSTDNTAELIDTLQQQSQQIRAIHVENGGAGKARNIGIQKAKGEWLCFLDADDYYLPDAIENILKLIHTPKIHKYDVIYGAITLADMQGNNATTRYPEEKIVGGLPSLEFVASLYKRSYLLDANIKFPTFREQDVETAFRFAAFNHTNKIYVAPQLSFYVYRNNPNSNVHTCNAENLYYVKSRVYSELLDSLQEVSNSVKANINGIMYGCIDRYMMMCLKEQLQNPERESRTALITNLGRHHLNEKGNIKTLVKKIVFISLDGCAQLLGKKKK